MYGMNEWDGWCDQESKYSGGGWTLKLKLTPRCTVRKESQLIVTPCLSSSSKFIIKARFQKPQRLEARNPPWWHHIF